MKIEIDPETLTSDERHRLTIGLEALEHPNPSCKKLLAKLKRLSREAYNKFCSEHPGHWV